MTVIKAMLFQTVFVLATLCMGRQQVVFSACSKGWTEYNGYCYTSILTEFWFEAQGMCKSNGADLASVLGPEENEFITKNMVPKPWSTLWIGLTRLDNGVYKWSDNSPLTYVNFKNSSLLNDPSAPCVTLLYSGQWETNNCKKDIDCVCKKRSTDSVSTTTPTPTTKAVKVEGCPPNFDSVPGASQCYHIGGKNSSEYKNFTEAIDACQALQPGATLASIHSGIDQRFVTTLSDGVPSDILIGLNDQNSTSGEFLSEWADRTEVTKVYWSEYQPDPYYAARVKSKSKCVYMEKKIQTAGRWSLGSCDVRRPYVCGHPKDPKFPVKIRHNKGCPTGFQKFRNSCYKFFKDPKTWSEAEATCINQNGHIVSLHNKYETAFIELLIDNVNQAWIGLSYKKTRNEYGWSDGWPIMFTDWGSKNVYPNMCAIDIFDEGWQTVSCDTKQTFVCEIDYDTIPTTTTVDVTCPLGWSPFQGNCYLFQLDATMSWDKAAAHCPPMGELTSILNPDESAFIGKWLNVYGYDAWIGLDRGRSGNAFWLDLSTLDYIDWASKVENQTWEVKEHGFMLEQYCVAADHRQYGKWVKVQCYKDKHFICKLRQDLIIKITSQPSIPPTTRHTDHSSHLTSTAGNLTSSSGSVGTSTHTSPTSGNLTSSSGSVGTSTHTSPTSGNLTSSSGSVGTSTHTTPTSGNLTSSSGSVGTSTHTSPTSGNLTSSSGSVATSTHTSPSATHTSVGHPTPSFSSLPPKTRSSQPPVSTTSSHITIKTLGRTGHNGSRLSAGDGAGIALGAVAFVALVVALAVLTRKFYLKRRHMDSAAFPFQNLNSFTDTHGSV